jgi:putative nucleotidyltransferase with HDIG domain
VESTALTKKQELILARANIVIVTIDQKMKVELARFFKALKWNSVKYVSSPQDFYNLKSNVPFDLVLVDEILPERAALGFAKTLDRLHKVPVGLIGNIQSLIDISVGYHPDEELFAFSMAPQDIEDEIVGVVSSILLPETVSDPAGDLAYCKVHIDDFITGKVARFDVYIRLARGRFIKITHQGDSMTSERLESYRKKHVRFLYMKRLDFSTYVGLTMQVAKGISTSDKITHDKKVSLMRHLGEVLVESCHFDGVSEQTFQYSAIFVESLATVLIEHDDVFKILLSLKDAGDRLFAHSAAVSLYSVMIARELGWDSPQVLFKIGTSGLLHDIGKRDMPREMLDKDRNDLTREERQVYETHTSRGAQDLSRISSVPAEILQIVLEHHENCLGHGFPQGLKKDKIHPMARLVAVANEFCDMVMHQNSGTKLKPKEIIERIYKANLVLFDPAYFAVLMAIFGMEIPLRLKLHYDKGGLRSKKNAA